MNDGTEIPSAGVSNRRFSSWCSLMTSG